LHQMNCPARPQLARKVVGANLSKSLAAGVNCNSTSRRTLAVSAFGHNAPARVQHHGKPHAGANSQAGKHVHVYKSGARAKPTTGRKHREDNAGEMVIAASAPLQIMGKCDGCGELFSLRPTLLAHERSCAHKRLYRSRRAERMYYNDAATAEAHAAPEAGPRRLSASVPKRKRKSKPSHRSSRKGADARVTAAKRNGGEEDKDQGQDQDQDEDWTPDLGLVGLMSAEDVQGNGVRSESGSKSKSTRTAKGRRQRKPLRFQDSVMPSSMHRGWGSQDDVDSDTDVESPQSTHMRRGARPDANGGKKSRGSVAADGPGVLGPRVPPSALLPPPPPPPGDGDSSPGSPHDEQDRASERDGSDASGHGGRGARMFFGSSGARRSDASALAPASPPVAAVAVQIHSVEDLMEQVEAVDVDQILFVSFSDERMCQARPFSFGSPRHADTGTNCSYSYMHQRDPLSPVSGVDTSPSRGRSPLQPTSPGLQRSSQRADLFRSPPLALHGPQVSSPLPSREGAGGNTGAETTSHARGSTAAGSNRAHGVATRKHMQQHKPAATAAPAKKAKAGAHVQAKQAKARAPGKDAGDKEKKATSTSTPSNVTVNSGSKTCPFDGCDGTGHRY